MATLDLSAIKAAFAFADNPIIVKATELSFPEGSIFRQVIFDVETYYDKAASASRTFFFAISADGEGSTVECDISSALRSTFAQFQYDASAVTSTGSITYPVVTYKVSIYTEWMIDGVTDSSGKTTSEIYRAFLGGLSEMERWKDSSTINCAITPTFTTKPAGEIRDKGQLIATTTYDSEAGEVKTRFSTAQSGTLDARDRTTILFVNSRGVYETVSVLATESEEYEVSAEVRRLVGEASYRPSPYITTHKEGGGASWKMSSGWVNREWAQWFAREFLMAKHYWLRKDNRWLPVAIEPKSDSVMTYDKNDPSLLAVNFTVTSALRG